MADSAKIERAEVTLARHPALTETRTVGGSAMTANADDYTDSGSGNNRKQSENWKSIGELARRLVEKSLG